MELKRYWRIIRSRIWIIGLLVLLFGTLSGIYSFMFTKEQFAASTKLIVNHNQDVSIINGKLDLSTINTNIQLIKTYKEIIRSPRIMNLVSEQYPDLGLSASELISMVGVSTVEQTQVMSIVAVDTSYERAAKVVNAVSRVFQNEIPVLMKVDNVSILNEADPSANMASISGNPVFSIVVSVIMALILGFGIVFFLYYLDDTIRNEYDVQQLIGLPVYTQIPKASVSRSSRGTNSLKSNTVRSEKNVTLEA